MRIFKFSWYGTRVGGTLMNYSDASRSSYLLRLGQPRANSGGPRVSHPQHVRIANQREKFQILPLRNQGGGTLMNYPDASRFSYLLRLGQPRVHGLQTQPPVIVPPPCAAPRPFLCLTNQKRLYWVALDVFARPQLMFRIPHVGVPIILGPELSRSAQLPVDFVRRKFLLAFHGARQAHVARFEQHVNVIRHYCPRA